MDACALLYRCHPLDNSKQAHIVIQTECHVLIIAGHYLPSQLQQALHRPAVEGVNLRAPTLQHYGLVGRRQAGERKSWEVVGTEALAVVPSNALLPSATLTWMSLKRS